MMRERNSFVFAFACDSGDGTELNRAEIRLYLPCLLVFVTGEMEEKFVFNLIKSN